MTEKIEIKLAGDKKDQSPSNAAQLLALSLAKAVSEMSSTSKKKKKRWGGSKGSHS